MFVMVAVRAPRIAETAFRKITTPPELQALILAEYANISFKSVEGEVQFDPDYNARQHGAISSSTDQGLDVGYAPVSNELFNRCYEILTPLIEAWAGCRLTRSWGYGIRSYGKGSILHLHRDRSDTHIISCIIHVDDRSDQPWPLDFIDHDGTVHRVPFQIGETLFYESLCPHARLTPFEGDYYRNMYLHWRPENWMPEVCEGLKTKYASIEECLKEWEAPEVSNPGD